jgi:hypothetical protein
MVSFAAYASAKMRPPPRGSSARRRPLATARMGGRAVECTGLEIRQSRKRFVGSNPTPSARNRGAFRLLRPVPRSTGPLRESASQARRCSRPANASALMTSASKPRARFVGNSARRPATSAEARKRPVDRSALSGGESPVRVTGATPSRTESLEASAIALRRPKIGRTCAPLNRKRKLQGLRRFRDKRIEAGLCGLRGYARPGIGSMRDKAHACSPHVTN